MRRSPPQAFQLLPCGRPDGWDTGQVATLGGRHAGTLAVHHLTREATPGALHEADGQAFAHWA